ncbi:MAG TPA: superoxide dismutase family protein [Polyangiaceae bacterium]|nr:superoxide dismutase family protein [Polyangiaceae bacterium]
MKLYKSLACTGPLLLAVACGGSQPEPEASMAPPPTASAETPPPAPSAAAPDPAAAPAEAASAAPEPPKAASFDITAKSNSKLTGNVTLTDTGSGVDVVITLAGVKPGKHGAHVHENPDCSAPDAKSAGSHYNPDSHPHGLPTAAEHHVGDLGNIDVGKDGKGKLEITMPGANLKQGDPHSFLGRSIIIHEKLDDGGQPVGNAGGRIGCVELK